VNLRTPGPTPCPPQVMEALGRQMIDHRGPEAAATIKRLTAGLKRAFQTQNDVVILTASGTGGLEAAVVNTISPGDNVLAVSVGVFGDRFASIAQTYGARVSRLSFEAGQAADPARIEQALAADPSISAVLVTHNETSTSVTNPLEPIAAAVRAADRLLLVDAISSMGSIPVATDGWGLDVVVSGSQKGWMVPPGLAFLSMSPRAGPAHGRCTAPRFYFDAARHRDSAEKGQTPWTPALSLFFALDVALEMLEREGWESVFERHARIAEFTRRGVRELGLELLADPRFASNTVTAVRAPEGVDVSALRRLLREEYGVVLAGGQGPLQGKIVRIGHLGLVSEDDISEALSALGKALTSLGFRPPARV
jgi:aspartate aminotransferase-like enzyme